MALRSGAPGAPHPPCGPAGWITSARVFSPSKAAAIELSMRPTRSKVREAHALLSRSTTSTRRPISASATETLTQDVVLPQPPLREKNAMTLMVISLNAKDDSGVPCLVSPRTVLEIPGLHQV